MRHSAARNTLGRGPQQRVQLARQGQQRVGRDVQRGLPRIPRRVQQRAGGEGLGRGEGRAVEQRVQPPLEALPERGRDGGELVVAAHVAAQQPGGGLVAPLPRDELLDVRAGTLVLVGDGHVAAGRAPLPRDGPRDAALVHDAHHEAALAGQRHGDPSSPASSAGQRVGQPEVGCQGGVGLVGPLSAAVSGAEH